MNTQEILARVDHTCLAVDATWEEVRTTLEEAVFYRCASACIPPSFVHKGADYVEGMVKICTVIGFPNGYSTTRTKVYEASEAVTDGADEIDMVINTGWLKNERYDDILAEIRAIRKAIKEINPKVVLKVIIETGMLTEYEKIKMCEIVSESGADYIKTSTVFSSEGATFDDIALFAKHVKNGVKIKAAGGISSIEDAEKFIALGAERLGSSHIVRLIKSQPAV